jgi:hypothetical protein
VQSYNNGDCSNNGVAKIWEGGVRPTDNPAANVQLPDKFRNASTVMIGVNKGHKYLQPPQVKKVFDDGRLQSPKSSG